MTDIRNIIFDFDGTLVDTAPLIIATMQETMRQMDLPMKTDDECRATIGLRLDDIPDVLWPELSGLGKEYAGKYRIIFDRLKRPLCVTCFPGVEKILRQLRETGFYMAIASSRSRKSLEEYVEQFGLTDCISMLVGGDDVSHGKPSPEPVLTILNRLNWQPGATLTVGDAPVDIMMGKSAGTHTCAVTYGNGNESDLLSAEPDIVIDDFRDLYEILKLS